MILVRYPSASHHLGALGEAYQRAADFADLFEASPPSPVSQPDSSVAAAASAAKVAAAALFAGDASAADFADGCGNFCLLDLLSAAPPSSPAAANASRPCGQSVGPAASGPAMIMDSLDTLAGAHTHPYMLSEAAAAAAHHFSVLSFDSVLYRSVEMASGAKGGASPQRASGVPESVACVHHHESEPIPADLNTPVTTSADVPTFFGPSTVVEPPPITGK